MTIGLVLKEKRNLMWHNACSMMCWFLFWRWNTLHLKQIGKKQWTRVQSKLRINHKTTETGHKSATSFNWYNPKVPKMLEIMRAFQNDPQYYRRFNVWEIMIAFVCIFFALNMAKRKGNKKQNEILFNNFIWCFNKIIKINNKCVFFALSFCAIHNFSGWTEHFRADNVRSFAKKAHIIFFLFDSTM